MSKFEQFKTLLEQFSDNDNCHVCNKERACISSFSDGSEYSHFEIKCNNCGTILGFKTDYELATGMYLEWWYVDTEGKTIKGKDITAFWGQHRNELFYILKNKVESCG